MSSDPEIKKLLRGNYHEMSSPHQMADLCMQGPGKDVFPKCFPASGILQA
jgi:hypothetical protein